MDYALIGEFEMTQQPRSMLTVSPCLYVICKKSKRKIDRIQAAYSFL